MGQTPREGRRYVVGGSAAAVAAAHLLIFSRELVLLNSTEGRAYCAVLFIIALLCLLSLSLLLLKTAMAMGGSTARPDSIILDTYQSW